MFAAAGEGLEIGIDGSVTVVETGGAGEIDTASFSDPVIGFSCGEQASWPTSASRAPRSPR